MVISWPSDSLRKNRSLRVPGAEYRPLYRALSPLTKPNSPPKTNPKSSAQRPQHVTPTHHLASRRPKFGANRLLENRRRRRQVAIPLAVLPYASRSYRGNPPQVRQGQPIKLPQRPLRAERICERISGTAPASCHCGQSLSSFSFSFSLSFFSEDYLCQPFSPLRAGGSGEEGARRGPLREAWPSAGASFS